jgi:outer membrane immunogenic protein
MLRGVSMFYKLLGVVGVLSLVIAAALSNAVAADMSLKAPPLQPVASLWTGCYVGADVGYAWQRDADGETIAGTGTPSGFSPAPTNPNGIKGGGFIGCNWQPSGHWVVGLEGDAEGSDVAHSDGIYAPSSDFYESRTGFQGSIRARLGWAVDRSLLYATGGVAFASIQDHYVGLETDGLATNVTDSRTGWTAGAGWDYAFTNAWIGRIEYRHADFGSVTNTVSFCVSCTVVNEKHLTTEDAIRFGIAYRFGGPFGPK